MYVIQYLIGLILTSYMHQSFVGEHGKLKEAILKKIIEKRQEIRAE